MISQVEADRRALGRRRRRLSEWATSPCSGQNGTANTATPSAVSGKATKVTVGELAYRLTGSPDLYQHSGRRPMRASISSPRTTVSPFTTSSVTTKSITRPTEKRIAMAITIIIPGTTAKKVRPKIRRFSSSVASKCATCSRLCSFRRACPMITAGDEWARTQQGNNNAYCQDNEISWLNWEHGEEQKSLLEFTKNLIRLRREHPVFRRPKFFKAAGSAARKFAT